MAKKVKKGFNIASPDIKTIYIGKGHKQMARYLQLHKNFGRQQFNDDLKNGARIYESFVETLDLKGTRYNMITAPTEEDGLRAVAYLAGIFAENTGYDETEIMDDYADDDHAKEYDLENGDEDYIFEEDELFEDDPMPDYEECFYRIPIIDLEEVVMENNKSYGYGFGMLNMELQNNGRKIEPWWNNLEDYSVCVIKRNVHGDFPPYSGELLMHHEIECLKRFSGNEHVYVLVIDRDIREDDYSIVTASLEYTANSFRVDEKADVILRYYRKLLEDAAARHGFKFSGTVDVPLLADKLSKINSQYPCREYEKIMEYLVHTGAPDCLKSDCFEKLGLKKLIDRMAGDTEKTLDAELVGMEEVKKQVNNIINMLRYVKMREARGIRNSRFHNVHLFLGAPGTAKTTVAKMMSNMMQKEGLINGNRFVSVTGAQLKGAFVGQTAPKVHALFQQYDAIFIDEAYSLACGSESEGGMDSYSQEALAQLAVELEDHATDKLVIFAGYGGRNVSKKNNLMHKFLLSNPGISSRINSTIYFDSYTPDNMVEIIHRLAELSSIKLSGENDVKIAEYFKIRQNESDFGNGREARVFLEHCERSVAERVAGKDPDSISDKELNTVTAEDIICTIDALKEKRSAELGQFSRKLGFI